LGVLASALLFASAATATPLFDPILRFREIRTDHFVIYFHQGEDGNASRLATIVEETWTALRNTMTVMPPPLTHVVLVDQTELANGSATPVPYNTIIVTATWPPGSEFLGRTDDWLRLVFTHEFTHIVHLDRSEGWARVVRALFGRVPIAFPNQFLPVWQIEGLAVYEESAITGQGRLHAGDFRAIDETTRRNHLVVPLDRVGGGVTDWPGGLAPYAYGLGFHAFLAERYGFDKLAALADATAGRVPYTASRTFKPIFGKSLGELWSEYQASPVPGTGTIDDTVFTRLTHHGFDVSGPRFAGPACAECPGEIIYSVQTPDRFPSLNAVSTDGRHSRELTTRYLGSTSGVGHGVVVFDQQEYRRNVGLYSDLFVLDRTTGRVRSLTNELRLLDPDLSPDGKTIVCVRSTPDSRDLVTIPLTQSVEHAPALNVLVAEPGTQFDAPRWSPDGTTVVAARHRLGGQSEIVTINVATREVFVVATSSEARIVTPTWRPDGGAIIAAADFDDGPFDLYEFNLDGRTSRRLTRTATGATWPDVSPDGATIVFVGYTTDGFDLFTMPYSKSDESYVGPVFRPAEAAALKSRPTYEASTPARASTPYRPWPTLKPTSWTPFFQQTSDQFRAGALVSGYDVLGYHGYALSATWLVNGPDAVARPNAATPDWDVVYSYARWRPIFFATTSRTTSFFAGPATATGSPTNSTLRESVIEGGVDVPFLHARFSHFGFASILRINDDYTLPGGGISVKRTALREAWGANSSHFYGYSISSEDGVGVGVTAEEVPKAFDSVADASVFTLDTRVYLPGLGAHHVLALRAALGVSNGDPIAGRTFLLGGAAPAPDVVSFSSSAMALLRGFPSDTFAGSRIGIVNADYRFPIARPERGHGTVPLLLHTIHGALFVDAGNAWANTFLSRDVKVSAGAELSANVVLGYVLPLTATIGAAWGHDGAHRVPDTTTGYVRVGRAF
jgi:hypothetical protein